MVSSTLAAWASLSLSSDTFLVENISSTLMKPARKDLILLIDFEIQFMV